MTYQTVIGEIKSDLSYELLLKEEIIQKAAALLQKK